MRRSPDRYTLNLNKLRSYRSDWPWDKFEGGTACIKWSFRDLLNLDAALQITSGRKVVVQAGGNLGIFPKRLAEEFETVYTFEPHKGLFNQMRRNAPEPNIVAMNAALGCERTGVSVRCARRDTSGRAVHEGLTHITGEGLIKQILIDDLSLNACDLIYLDIEGYELNALKGAVKTIAQFKPVIGVEINRNIEYYGSSANDVRDWMLGMGYKLSLSMNSDEVFSPC